MEDNTYIALDLEMNQPSGKIIQVGVCIGNIVSGEILRQQSWYVNPGETISEYITTLTGISNAHIESESYSLKEAYDQLSLMAVHYGANRSLITWGCGDQETLREQLKIESTDPKDWHFGRRYLDVKTLYQCLMLSRNQTTQGGLAKAIAKMGLRFEGKKHDAGDDAYNTFLLFRRLLKEFKNK